MIRGQFLLRKMKFFQSKMAQLIKPSNPQEALLVNFAELDEIKDADAFLSRIENVD
jgi:hypothetical protein